MVLEEVLKERNQSFAGLTVALQGFGNVGSFAALLMAEQGAKIVAVGDHMGGVSKADGLDVPALVEWTREHRTVNGFPGGDAFSSEDVLTWDADVLIPAALGDVLTADNAAEVRAKIVVEAANAPTTPEADEILRDKGVLIVPDILANAGGVTVSYFEWVQNIQQFRWDEKRVNDELERILTDAHKHVRKLATSKKVALRTAAFVLAIGRVGKAHVLRGL